MRVPLKELMPFQYSVLEQDAAKLRTGVLAKIGGVFQRAEQKNANGRIYPRKLWTNILQDPDVKTRIEARRMVGLLGHPASGQTDPEKIALVITKQELRPDNEVYGEAEILDTPMGRIADTLLRAGVGLGISSRGDGSVEKKGDSDFVQDDYKFETYDLVLKPSTSGAYPEMLSECTVEKHEKLVAEAIGGLVNSEGIPECQRLPLLTECLKILSVLEAKNSGNLVQSLSAKIQEELGSSQGPISVSADDGLTPGFIPQHLSEDHMAVNQNGTPNLSEDTLRWHKGQIKSAMEHVSRTKDQENSQLKDTLIKAQREHTETRKRLKAAESLIEDFNKEVKRLRESAPSDRKLVRRYEAAVELLDEALKRLPEIGSLGRRCRTLEGLVQAGFDHIMEERKGRTIKEHLSRISPKFHETVRPVLEGCRTPEQVAQTFKALVAVSNGGAPATTRRSDPLPRVNENRPRRERQRVNESVNPPVDFASRMARRLGKAVG
jgi:hypothetical protein